MLSKSRMINKASWFILAISLTHGYTTELAIEPYLQAFNENSITIVWLTDSLTTHNSVHVIHPVQSVITATSEQMDGVIFVRHVATVKDLKASTEYEYYVESDGTQSQRYKFRSAGSREEPFHFIYLGDGQNSDNQVIIRRRALYKTIMDLKPNFIICGGDTVEYGTYNSYEKTWESFFRQICTTTEGGLPVASTIPHYFVVGNHEIYDPEHDYYASGGLAGTSMARFKAFCINPDNEAKDPRWRGRYYSFTYGSAMFIVLDLNNTSNDTLDNHDKIPDGCSPDWEPGSEQYLWMIEQLKIAKSTCAFTFIFAHPSPYSRGVHGTYDKAIDYQRGYELRTLDPVFRSYGVDAVFSSHDHIVEHCLTGTEGYWVTMDVNNPDNLNYLVQGNSGNSARDPHSEWKRWMQIPGAPPEKFYTVWFYDWNQANNPTTVRCSFYDVKISKISVNTYQATFQLISIDGLPEQMRNNDVSTSNDHVFTIHRTDPAISNEAAPGNHEVFASQKKTDSNSKNTLLYIVAMTGIVITTLVVLAVVGKKLLHNNIGTPKL
jgi:hypothetical protein